MPIVEGVAAARAAFEVSKVVLDLTRYPKLDLETIHARLLELQGLILSAQQVLGEVAEENRQLRADLDDKDRRKEIGKDFSSEEGVYWKGNYPYCPVCWDADLKPVRMSGPFAANIAVHVRWTCPTHNSTYFVKRRNA
jgi:hypothetical protein